MNIKVNLAFNSKALVELIEIDPDGENGLIGSLITAYKENSVLLYDQVVLGTGIKDPKKAEAALHSLRSSSAVLGLERLAALCGELEDKIEIDIPTTEELKLLQQELNLGLKELGAYRLPTPKPKI